jgi:ribonuclease PH
MLKHDKIKKTPEFHWVAAVSVGIYRQQVVLDLDYAEDVVAETDMNIIMNDQGRFIELQGTAEDGSFDHQHLQAMIEAAQAGIQELIGLQKQAVGL